MLKIMTPILILIAIFLFFNVACEDFNNEIWISNPISWQEQEGEYPYATNGEILYLNMNGTCRIIKYSLIKDTESDSIALEPNSGNIFTGKWEKSKNQVIVTTKLFKSAAKSKKKDDVDTLKLTVENNMLKAVNSKISYLPFDKFDQNSLLVIKGM